MNTTTKRSAALDCELLCDAMRTIIMRLVRVAREAGYRDDQIETMIAHEESLVNRIEIGMSETTTEQGGSK